MRKNNITVLCCVGKFFTFYYYIFWQKIERLFGLDLVILLENQSNGLMTKFFTFQFDPNP